ncbi:DUF350 domain-containing protein [Pontivivens ytuae]|uniref:DUF350 domain-containing protein n=1 Tax=Pontivivens ytuae TaxID=2789856 RepID=A0A7S9LSQ2_9RHOB|nr:DUF350 domain-containing protein [Pontivivens ytuae]QPH54609.1 DUF350 domain-containing protein [Pontivivens ytuae]
MNPFETIIFAEIVATIFYTALGVGLLIVSWIVIEWLTPFSLRREVEEEQNMAIAVLMGSLFLAISILIAAVIVSG